MRTYFSTLEDLRAQIRNDSTALADITMPDAFAECYLSRFFQTNLAFLLETED
jgi:hypothetical protein